MSAQFVLPPTDGATISAEWAVTTSGRVHPHDINPRIVATPDDLRTEIAEWRQDFAAAVVWRRTRCVWPDGALFVSAWTVATKGESVLADYDKEQP